MSKRALEYLSELPPDIMFKCLFNCIKQRNKKRLLGHYSSTSQVVDWMFTWNESKEGYNFWSKIHEELEQQQNG